MEWSTAFCIVGVAWAFAWVWVSAINKDKD
jgi:hypothetical protein